MSAGDIVAHTDNALFVWLECTSALIFSYQDSGRYRSCEDKDCMFKELLGEMEQDAMCHISRLSGRRIFLVLSQTDPMLVSIGLTDCHVKDGDVLVLALGLPAVLVLRKIGQKDIVNEVEESCFKIFERAFVEAIAEEEKRASHSIRLGGGESPSGTIFYQIGLHNSQFCLCCFRTFFFYLSPGSNE